MISLPLYQWLLFGLAMWISGFAFGKVFAARKLSRGEA